MPTEQSAAKTPTRLSKRHKKQQEAMTTVSMTELKQLDQDELQPSDKGKQSNKQCYKHIPHSQKPPHLVAKRNARERRRVQAVNQAFYRLRRSVPIENRNKRVSKVKTLQRAIDYIRKLERVLAEDADAAADCGGAADSTSGGQQQAAGQTPTRKRATTRRAAREQAAKPEGAWPAGQPDEAAARPLVPHYDAHDNSFGQSGEQASVPVANNSYAHQNSSALQACAGGALENERAYESASAYANGAAAAYDPPMPVIDPSTTSNNCADHLAAASQHQQQQQQHYEHYAAYQPPQQQLYGANGSQQQGGYFCAQNSAADYAHLSCAANWQPAASAHLADLSVSSSASSLSTSSSSAGSSGCAGRPASGAPAPRAKRRQVDKGAAKSHCLAPASAPFVEPGQLLALKQQVSTVAAGYHYQQASSALGNQLSGARAEQLAGGYQAGQQQQQRFYHHYQASSPYEPMNNNQHHQQAAATNSISSPTIEHCEQFGVLVGPHSQQPHDGLQHAEYAHGLRGLM